MDELKTAFLTDAVFPIKRHVVVGDVSYWQNSYEARSILKPFLCCSA